MGEAKRRKQLDPSFGKNWWQKENTDSFLEVDPDYQNLTNLYLSQGVAALTSTILDWLIQSSQICEGETPSTVLNRVNQIAMTVYEMASKQSKILTSHDLKLASFTLKIPFKPDDFGSYAPVMNNRGLATEAMRLINTGFFDAAITALINREGDAVGILRKYGIVLYMGTNSALEIIDAACGLVTWKPFEVVAYAGEQRDSLNGLIQNTFRPLADKIQKYRTEQKGADRFPCLSLLCLIENKVGGAICEFRKHFTSQSSGQLVIPGYSSDMHGAGAVAVHPPMNILGSPRDIPTIRGFNPTKV